MIWKDTKWLLTLFLTVLGTVFGGVQAWDILDRRGFTGGLASWLPWVGYGCFLLVSAWAATSFKRERDRSQGELHALNDRFGRLKSELDSATTELAGLRTDYETTSAKLTEANESAEHWQNCYHNAEKTSEERAA